MTALAVPALAAAARPLHRVECACAWVGYRRHPHRRPCPNCQAPAVVTLKPVWLAGCAPRKGHCAYLAHISPPYRHAEHYAGFTIDLPTRWRDHLAGGYDPETHRNRGKGARLLAAALHAGCQVELVRVWYGPQARQLEQQLKQRRKPGSLRAGARRSLKPLCPLCDSNAHRHYPQLTPAPQPPRTRFRHDPQVWDADREWDLAFPELACGVAQT
jgi:hypothetical protein